MTHDEKRIIAAARRDAARAVVGLPYPDVDNSRGRTGRRRARRYARKVTRAFREEILVKARADGKLGGA